MLSSACRGICQRPASLSDLWCLTPMAGTSSSLCPEMTKVPAVWGRSTRPPFSSSRGWWLRPAERKGRIFTLPKPVRLNNSSGASQLRQFGAANMRPASLSDLGHVPRISSTGSSRSPSAQAMTKLAVWRRSTRPLFSLSQGRAFPSGFRGPCPSNLQHILEFSGSSSQYLSGSVGRWLRPAAGKGRILTLPEPVRLNYSYSGASQLRQFGTGNQRLASLSDLGHVPPISSTGSSGSPSAHAMAKAAAWWQPTSPTFLFFRGQASAPAFLSGLVQARQFGTAKQRQRQTMKQHLYLALDDHVDGFSIHKLDIDNDLDVGCGSAGNPLSFSEPPVLRIGAPLIGKSAQFAALGSHIIGTCAFAFEIPTEQEAQEGVTVTFDTKTAKLTRSTILPQGLSCCYDAAIAVRNRLYVFESYTNSNDGFDSLYFFGGFHCLAADPNDDDRDWSWKPLFNSSQFSWSWSELTPYFPFDPKFITSLAVHPRTGTIFVSACRQGVWGTFSYGTRGGGKWKRRGAWVLPFKGPAHYDDVLGAWVGLHIHSVVTKDDADGYLCACHIMSGRQPPKWKVGSKKLF